MDSLLVRQRKMLVHVASEWGPANGLTENFCIQDRDLGHAVPISYCCFNLEQTVA
jgi:hypothetical protein